MGQGNELSKELSNERPGIILYVITAHKRSLAQSNVFTRICHSLHGEGLASQHASQFT